MFTRMSRYFGKKRRTSGNAKAAKPRKSLRLHFDTLEDRLTPTTSFTPGNIIADVVGTGSALNANGTATALNEIQTDTISSTALAGGSYSATAIQVTTNGSTTGFQANNLVQINGSTKDGSYTILNVSGNTFVYDPGVAGVTFTFPGATATSQVQSISLTSTGSSAFTEGGTSTKEGYLTDSSDGHTAEFAGYNVAAGTKTTGANAVVAVVYPNGTVNTSTQIPVADTEISTTNSVKAVASADGLGFYVATDNFIQYVPFGNNVTTPSTTISNFFTSGPYQSTQSPNAVAIINGQLYGDAGAQFQSTGVPSADGPFTVGSGLPTTSGQSEAVLAGLPVTSSGNPAQYLTSEQFSISPDGETIIVADARTNGQGGLYIYQNTLGSPANYAEVYAHTYSSSGLTGLSVNWGNATADSQTTYPVIYAVTTNSATGDAGNSIVEFTAVIPTTANSGNGFPSGGSVTGPMTLATAPTNESFRGVALAPSAAGATQTTTALTATAGTYPNATLSARVVPQSGTGTPTGFVSFQSNGVEIGSAPLVNGTATLTPTSDFNAASYTNLVAVYTGDSTYASSTSPSAASTGSPFAVAQATPGVTLLPQYVTTTSGVVDTLTAAITVPSGTSAAPDNAAMPTQALDGTVTFYNVTGLTQPYNLNSATNLGTATVMDVVSQDHPTFTASLAYTFPTSQATAQNIIAVYNGNQDFSSQQSSPVSVYVAPPSTTVVTTSNASPTVSTTNTPNTVTLTATVTGTAGTAPTGTVIFYIDQVPVPASASAVTYTPNATAGTLTATITLPTSYVPDGINPADKLLPGLQTITADYNGTNFFNSYGVYEQAVQAKPFAAGDSFVEKVGDGVTPLAPTKNQDIGATIYINEYTPTGTLVQSIILPSGDGTGSQSSFHAIVSDAQQEPDQLTLSSNGQDLFVTGYDSNNPWLPQNVNTAPLLHYSSTTPRAVARINLSGVVQTIELAPATSSTSDTGVETSYDITGVYSPDGNQFYLTGGYGTPGDSGVDYFSSFTPSASAQNYTAEIINTSDAHDTEGLENLNGNLVAVGLGAGATYGGTQQLVSEFSGMPTAAATPTTLPGLPTGDSATSPYDVYFTHLDGSGAPAGINTMYLTDATGYSNGSITKWSYNGTTWSLTATLTAASTGNPGFYWISGTTDANGNVTLYTTYANGGNGVTGPGYLYTITDSGYGSNAFATANVNVLEQYPTGSNQVLAGVAVLVSPTTTTLSGPANPTTPNTNVSFTVSVTPSIGTAPTAPDFVYIENAYNNNAVVATKTLTTNPLTFTLNEPVGTYDLFAVYPGSSTIPVTDAGSTSSAVLWNNTNTSTTLTDNGPNNPSTFGSNVSFTFNVTTSPSGGTFASTDTVQIEDASNGNAVVATEPISQNGTPFNISTLTVGSHSLFAVFVPGAGESTYTTSQSAQIPTPQVVTNPTTITLGAPGTTAPATGTNDLTFTATVSASSGTLPTGTVTFYDNGVAISGTPVYTTGTGNTLVATLTASTALTHTSGALTPGIHSITATFTAAGNFNNSSTTSAINQAVAAQAFGAGDQLVYRVGDGVNSWNSTNATEVFADEYNLSGVLQQTIALPSADGNGYYAVTNIGNQQVTGQLTLSGIGDAVFLAGYDAAFGSSNPAAGATENLTVAKISYNGTVTTEQITGATPSSGSYDNYLSGVISPDDNQVYLSGQESFGILYVPSFTNDASVAATKIVNATTSNYQNLYGLQIVGNTLYAASTTGYVGGYDTVDLVGTVGTLPTTANQTLTSLPGLPNGGGNYDTDVYLTNLPGGPAGVNTLYVTYDGGSSGNSYDAGDIAKYSLVSGSWTLNGVIANAPTPTGSVLPTGGTPTDFWLSGSTNNSTGAVTLYATWALATSSTSATASGVLETVTDTTGYNVAPTASLSAINTQSSTNAIGEQFHGLAAIPLQAVSTTTTVVSVPSTGINTSTSVTFTATVSGSPNVGTVTFYAGPGLTNPIGSPVNVVNGSASSTATTLVSGTDTITAVYSGGYGFAGSQGTVTDTVTGPTSTTTTVASTPASPITVGTSITFTATVSPNPGASDGTVSFYLGSVSPANQIGTAVNVTSSGTATSIADSSLPIGSDNIIAVYSGYVNGSIDYAGSQGTETVVVNVATTTAVSSSNTGTAPDVGTNDLTFTATVTPTTGTTEPTGTVQFSDNGISITGTVNYSAGANNSLVATLTVSTALIQAADSLTPGIHSITAAYSPTGFFASSSAAYNQAVAANAFGTGDQLVYRAGNSTSLWGTSSNLGLAVNVDEYNSSGVLQQTIAMPTADGNGYSALVETGNRAATGQLTQSANGGFVFLTGYDGMVTSGTVAYPSTTRTIARIDASGNVTTETITDPTGGASSSYPNYVDGVASPDGNQVYIGGYEDAGLLYLSNWTPGATNQAVTYIYNPGSAYVAFTSLEIAGNTLYAVTQSSSPSSVSQSILQFGATGTLPTSAVTPTTVLSLSSPYNYATDVYFTSLTGNGAPAGINTFYYTTENGSAGSTGYDAGAIYKYSLVSGVWTANNEILAAPTPNTGYPTGGTPGFYYLSGSTSGNTVTLYTTWNLAYKSTETGISGILETVQDTSGFNANVSSQSVTEINETSSASGVGELYFGVGAVPLKATPTISTTATPTTVTVGGTISDSATVSGGYYNLSGTVTFNLYNNANGTGPLLFTDTETLSSGSATSKSYTTAAAGTDYWFVSYSGDSSNSAASTTTGEAVTVNPAATPITITSWAVNGAQVTINGQQYNWSGLAQRSMVDNILVTFNQPVALANPNTDFVISLHSNVKIGKNNFTTEGTVPTLSVTGYGSPTVINSVNYYSAWEITFSGPSTDGGSIANGVYDINIVQGDVAGSTGGTLGAQTTQTFYRLFGDTNAGGLVTNSAAVGTQDSAAFDLAFGSSNVGKHTANYVSYLDYNGIGQIGTNDSAAFDVDFALSWSNFTATI